MIYQLIIIKNSIHERLINLKFWIIIKPVSEKKSKF